MKVIKYYLNYNFFELVIEKIKNIIEFFILILNVIDYFKLIYLVNEV